MAVPSPLSTKVTPEGSVPLSLSAAVGVPVVVTVKLPAVPVVKVVLVALVITGAWAAATVSVKLCGVALPTSLVALIVSG